VNGQDLWIKTFLIVFKEFDGISEADERAAIAAAHADKAADEWTKRIREWETEDERDA
jgi:hypothetical protein